MTKQQAEQLVQACGAIDIPAKVIGDETRVGIEVAPWHLPRVIKVADSLGIQIHALESV